MIKLLINNVEGREGEEKSNENLILVANQQRQIMTYTHTLYDNISILHSHAIALAKVPGFHSLIIHK